jgi:hypothetical protein
LRRDRLKLQTTHMRDEGFVVQESSLFLSKTFQMAAADQTLAISACARKAHD